MSLISIFFIHLLALISPGPDFVFISQTAANHPKKPTLLAILGITTAIAVWALLAITGLHFIFEDSPLLYRLLLCMGGSYLIWLGATSIVGSFQPITPINKQKKTIHRHFFIKGLITGLVNPKSLAYFGSIFSVAIAHSSIYQLLILFIMVVIESLVWFYLVASLFSIKTIANWYQTKLTIINFICGIAFICFGIGLIITLNSTY